MSAGGSLARSTMSCSRLGRNSCSGGSSVRMSTGEPSMAVNNPTKSLRCMGSSFASALRRVFSSRARIMACMCAMRSSAKNMCSVRHRPMPSAPNLRAALASRGMSALARTPKLPRNTSAHSMKEAITPDDGSASMVLAWPAKTWPVEPSSDWLSLDGVGLAGEDLAGGAIERQPVAFLQRHLLAVHGHTHFLALLVDRDSARSRHAGNAHAAGDHGCVTGHAAARCENALGDFHAVNVVRNGFGAHQDDGTLGGLFDGLIGGENHAAHRRARRCRQSGGDGG